MRKKEFVSPDPAATARRKFDEQLAATERLLEELEKRVARAKKFQEDLAAITPAPLHQKKK